MGKEETGKLVSIIGPMFSGKSSLLIAYVEREAIAGRRAVLFKPVIDTRYSAKEVAAHNGRRLEAIPVPTNKEGVKRIISAAKHADTIGIDEVEFWPIDSGIVEALEMLANKGKHIYAAGLNRDYRGIPFESVEKLLPRSDKIESLSAVCMKCGSENATFTQRIVNGKPVTHGKEEERILVGGKELYEPRCRKCFVFPNGERQKRRKSS